MGATGAILLVSGFLCEVDSMANIEVEEIDEPVIIESQRIIEGGFDVQTVSDYTDGVMVMADNIIIPTGGFNSTDVRYIVMCEGDDGVETLDFATSRVTSARMPNLGKRRVLRRWRPRRAVHGDVLRSAREGYQGRGRLFPDYVIHVPEGTLAEANGE